MKKFIVCLLAAALAVTSVSCSADKSEEEMTFEVDSDEFTYENITTGVGSLDVDENGTLYAVETYIIEKEPYDEVYDELHAYDLNGVHIKKLETGGAALNTVSYHDSTLYSIGCSNGEQTLSIYSYDLRTDEFSVFAKTSVSSSSTVVTNSVIADGKLWFTVEDFGRELEGCPYDNSVFTYQGTVLYSCDLQSGKTERSDIEYPVTVSTAADGSLCVYAVDENGTYFITGEEKYYMDLGYVYAFAVISDKNDFVFTSSLKYDTLNIGTFGSDDYAEFRPNTSCSAKTLRYRGGCTFYTNSYGNGLDKAGAVQRIKNSSFVAGNRTINLISPGFIMASPFGCGYSMNSKELTDTEFALTVLSQSPDYDICLLNSKLGVSDSIRDKGTFYPLNEVEGVSEYLDKCFPYVKEAALTSDGEIWMLPIAVDIDVIMYNEALCEKYGLDFNNDMTLEELILNAKTANESDKSSGYAIHGYLLNTNLLLQYMRNNISFDTEEFRDLARYVKEEANYSEGEDYFKLYTDSMNQLYEGNSDGFLFSMLNDSLTQLEYGFSDTVRACPMPSVTSDGRSVATCVMLCVNPASDNLSSVLDYITALTEYLSANNSSMLFSEHDENVGQYVKDLYGIYSDASICFNISEDIYRQDYEAYLSGSTDLDGFITEADRKLSAYLNE